MQSRVYRENEVYVGQELDSGLLQIVYAENGNIRLSERTSGKASQMRRVLKFPDLSQPTGRAAHGRLRAGTSITTILGGVVQSCTRVPAFRGTSPGMPAERDHVGDAQLLSGRWKPAKCRRAQHKNERYLDTFCRHVFVIFLSRVRFAEAIPVRGRTVE